MSKFVWQPDDLVWDDDQPIRSEFDAWLATWRATGFGGSFSEDKHPRDPAGKFASGSGGKVAGKPVKKQPQTGIGHKGPARRPKTGIGHSGPGKSKGGPLGHQVTKKKKPPTLTPEEKKVVADLEKQIALDSEKMTAAQNAGDKNTASALASKIAAAKKKIAKLQDKVERSGDAMPHEIRTLAEWRAEWEQRKRKMGGGGGGGSFDEKLHPRDPGGKFASKGGGGGGGGGGKSDVGGGVKLTPNQQKTLADIAGDMAPGDPKTAKAKKNAESGNLDKDDIAYLAPYAKDLAKGGDAKFPKSKAKPIADALDKAHQDAGLGPVPDRKPASFKIDPGPQKPAKDNPFHKDSDFQKKSPSDQAADFHQKDLDTVNSVIKEIEEGDGFGSDQLPRLKKKQKQLQKKIDALREKAKSERGGYGMTGSELRKAVAFDLEHFYDMEPELVRQVMLYADLDDYTDPERAAAELVASLDEDY